MPRNLEYKSDLLDDLRTDKEYAALYLSEAIRDSNEAFLVALRDVVEASLGMAGVATAAEVNRESLYRSLSKGGNPRLSTFVSVLRALGLRLKVEPAQEIERNDRSPAGRERKPLRSIHGRGAAIRKQSKR
jgi:probable addiction module antidote protein